jgi:two-component system cell cycle response regulator
MSERPDAPYVLVVDDDWTGRELLETYLKLGGYRVGLANSGEKALEMAFAGPPALVMLDVRLTDMDGFEVCRRLRADPRTHSVPVLLVTAFDSEADRQQGTEAGADGFIVKPFEIQVMLAQVQSVLKKA